MHPSVRYIFCYYWSCSPCHLRCAGVSTRAVLGRGNHRGIFEFQFFFINTSRLSFSMFAHSWRSWLPVLRRTCTLSKQLITAPLNMCCRSPLCPHSPFCCASLTGKSSLFEKKPMLTVMCLLFRHVLSFFTFSNSQGFANVGEYMVQSSHGRQNSAQGIHCENQCWS